MPESHKDRQHITPELYWDRHVGDYSTTLVATDIISEGPIYGLEAGPSSVFLDNVPVADANRAGLYASSTPLTLTVTSGSNTGSLTGASTQQIKALSFETSEVGETKKITLIGGAYNQEVTAAQIETGDDPQQAVMKLTTTGGASTYFNDARMALITGARARLKGNATTEFRDVEGVVIKRSHTTSVHFKLGSLDAGFTELLDEGTYILEVDREIEIASVTSLDETFLTSGQLKRSNFKPVRKVWSPANDRYLTEYTWYSDEPDGYTYAGPPFPVDDNTTTVDTIMVEDAAGEASKHQASMWYGYFKPPVDGVYDFKIITDDGGGVWLGPEASSRSKTSRRKGNTIAQNHLGENCSPKTSIGSTPYLKASEYYPVRFVNHNNEGPRTFQFFWKGGTQTTYTSTLTPFYYPSPNDYIDLENVKFTTVPDFSGTFKVNVQSMPQNTNNISVTDVVKPLIEGGSVTFRVGDRLQPSVNNSSGLYTEAISHAPQLTVPLDKHSNYGGSAADTVLQGTTTSGFNLTSEQVQAMDGIKILFNYPSGIYQMNNEGTRWKAVAAYKVSAQFKDVGETDFNSNIYVLSERMEHRAKTDNAVNFSVEIDLTPFKPFKDFKIIIERITNQSGDGYSILGDGSFATQINTGLDIFAAANISLCTSLYNETLTYPYTAYAQVSYSTKEFQAFPKRTYKAKGLLVKVPSNYVTRDEASDGIASYNRNITTGAIEQTYQNWDGTLRDAKVYTNNPAWVFYDIVTNNRYGLGEFIDTTDLDIYALYRIARYCDEQVSDGKGSFEPRFTCNLYLAKATDCYKVLKDMATNFRSMLYWIDGKILPVMDQEKEPVYNFSKANVVEGNFSYETTGSKTRSNQIMVSWNNPENEYKLEELLVEDRQNIVKTGRVINQKATAFGCTSEGQALRFGRWKLWTAANQTEIVSFKASMATRFILPGDIINIQDSDRARVRLAGRVSSTGDRSVTKVPLDRAVTLKDNHVYDLSIVIVSPGAFLAEESLEIWQNNGGSERLTFEKGEYIKRAWIYDPINQVWELSDINTKEKSVNAKANPSASDSLTLAWAEHTSVERRRVSTASNSNAQVSVLDTTTAFSEAPEAERIWVLEEITDENTYTDASSKQYKVLSIEEEADTSVFTITAAEHFNEKYGVVDETFSTVVERTPLGDVEKGSTLKPVDAMALQIVPKDQGDT